MAAPIRFTREELLAYVQRMPAELAATIRDIKETMKGETGYDLQERNEAMFRAVREVWLDLVEQLPTNVFGRRAAGEVFDSAMRARVDIYSALQEPNGLGTGGSIAPQMVTSHLFEDAKVFVRIAAECLVGLGGSAESLRELRTAWSLVDVSA